MSAQLDVDVLPVNRRGGYDQPDIPGLHLGIPPRRSARGRAEELLISFFQGVGSAALAPSEITQLQEALSRTYYQTRGSVTAAIRRAIEELNQHLLDRNLRSAGSGLQLTGLLTVVAVRGPQLYLAQAGPTHAFIVNDEESQHYYDAHLSGRGIGISRTPTIRFSYADMRTGGLLIVSPAPPPTWTASTLNGSHRLRIESLHRRLVTQAGPDLTAVLFLMQPGQGRLHLVQPVAARPAPRPSRATDSAASSGVSAENPPMPPARTAPPIISPQPTRPEQIAIPERKPPAHSVAAPPTPRPAAETAVSAATAPEAQAAAEIETTSGPARAQEAAPLAEPVAPREPSAERRISRRTSAVRTMLGPALLRIGQAIGTAGSEALLSVRSILGRMLPGEGLLTIPSSVMALIAISVPLIVVTIASVVYFQRGQAAQHQRFLHQARQAADAAGALTDPDELRQAWSFTLGLLDQAESYQSSDEARALRAQASQALDDLNWTERLEFQPAIIGGLGPNDRIVRMVATSEDLYLLNAEDGSVLRAWLTGRGYELDPAFRCSPGAYGAYIVGPLIDLAPMPKGNELNATVLAIDANGNLLYCQPGEAPLSAPLVPPDSLWGMPTAITVDSGDLYVLDPQTNAVWTYRGANGSFRDRPRFFFAEEVPTLPDVVDLAVNRLDLYLLHADGSLTTCTFSGLAEAPTRCQDPNVYVDNRPGRQEGPLIADATFTQILFTPPPDPSIYLLDPAAKAIYHFSLRLTLQRQFRSSTPLPETPATAFAVSPNRTIFLGIGNQIFLANLP